MKKLKYILFLLILLPFTNVNAATINCSAPDAVSVGETFNVTFSGSLSSQAAFYLGTIGSSDNVSYISGGLSFNFEYGQSHTASFKAISEGTASFYAYDVDASDGDNSYNDSDTCYVSIYTPQENNDSNTNNYTAQNNNDNDEQNLSEDTYLKSLSIENFKISPKFDKDKLEYKVDLSSDTTKIKIVAEKNDDTQTISGDGEFDVKEGNNTFNIVVTSASGNQRTYKINAYKPEKDAIIVKIDNIKYTLLKKLVGINAPEGFEISKITIDNQEIESFYNKKIKYNVVALKDSIGNITLFIYDENLNKYYKYLPIVSQNLSVIPIKANSKDIPNGYKLTKFKYNNEEIEGYALSEKSDFRLIYGIDTNGKKGFYQYDIKNQTIQRFSNEHLKMYLNLLDKSKLAIIILGSFIIFLTIIIIILLSKNVKFKKIYIKKLSPIDNIDTSKKIKYQNLEETNMMEKFDEEDEPKKKKKHKKEKTFLDE